MNTLHIVQKILDHLHHRAVQFICTSQTLPPLKKVSLEIKEVSDLFYHLSPHRYHKRTAMLSQQC